MNKFLFLLIPLLSFQQKPIDVFVDKSHSTISILYDDKIDSYDLNDNFHLKKSNKILNFSDFDLTTFKFVNQSKLSSNYGGNVLVVKNDSIKKIDNSFEHKMQINSIEFTRNDTIFRYGGYGFFECRNFFTYYDNKVNEWESLDINGNVIPERITDFVYLINNDKLYISGGFKFDQFKKDKKIENFDTYVFDFKTKKWSLKGKMKIHLIGNNSIKVEDEVFVFQDGWVYKLNFESNTIITYDKNSISKKIESSVLKPLFYNGNILFFNFQNDKIKIFSLPIKNFIFGLEIKNSGQIYYNYPKFIFVLSSILSVLFLIFIINKFVIKRFYKKLRKVNENYFYNFVIIPLSNDEKRVLDILYLSSKNFESVENRLITDFFDDETLNYGTINRRKNETIQQLNNKLKLLLKTSEDVIIKENSQIDKREVTYTLNSIFL